jgi:hypothetical protein
MAYGTSINYLLLIVKDSFWAKSIHKQLLKIQIDTSINSHVKKFTSWGILIKEEREIFEG